MEIGTGATSALARLRQQSEQPFEAARTAPPQMYWLPEIAELEQRLIFCRDWVCVGLSAEIPRTGDYLTYTVAGQPVLVLRGTDGRIRSFSNVCRHRLMPLVDGRGSVDRLLCPYHAWHYNLDGQLVGAGHMRQTPGFSVDKYRLPEIRTEVWNGWIYVSLNNAAPAVADALLPLQSAVAPYAMADYVPILSSDENWQTNWKLVVENFTENYHGPIVHRSTVGVGAPVSETVFSEDSFDSLSFSTFIRTEAVRYGHAHPNNTRLTGRERVTTVLAKVFPSHLLSLAPDLLWFLLLRPVGPGQTQIRFGMALAPDRYADLPDAAAFAGEMKAFFDQVNGEDRTVVEGIYRGAQAPLAESGPYSWLEREIYEFMRYVARRLAPALET